MLYTWLSGTLRRYYPASPPEPVPSLQLDAARGEQVAFQALCRTAETAPAVAVSLLTRPELPVAIRRVGYVPVPHFSTETPTDELDGIGYLPGYAPDPLFPEACVHAGPHETNAFWITVFVPLDAAPGAYSITVSFTARGTEPAPLHVTLIVHPAVLPLRRDFPVTHWFYADALCDWYGVQPFDEAFWRLLATYQADLAGHGQDTMYVPLFTPPTDGVKRPTQLLAVQHTPDGYEFDWSLVRRWLHSARAQGLSNFEWTHLFTQWGTQHAIRIYEGRGETETLLWPSETSATSAVYRDFLAQFLPAFKRFLETEGVMQCSFFHVSDEPHSDQHVETYRAARHIIHQLAPWMRVMDALTDIRFAREGLTDIPVPLITTAPDFAGEGFPAWAYFCCVPRGRYLNRLLDTPLVKVRMSGWLFYRTAAHGFLHWGYNYWYRRQSRTLIDPYTITDALAWPDWAHGDPFVVYPGAVGPIDSLRWEVFAESLQDYALLQGSGIAPADPSLSALHDYATFPRDEDWIAQRRAALLALLDHRQDASR